MHISTEWINQNIAKYGGKALIAGKRVPVQRVRRVEYIREVQLMDGTWKRFDLIEWDMGFSFYSLSPDEVGY